MEISSSVQAELDNYNKELNKWLDAHSPLSMEDYRKQSDIESSLFNKLSIEAQKAKKEGFRNLQKRMKSQLQD
jgi:hypothetical protein